MGYLFFGRYWKNGSTYGGYGISLTTINNLTSKYQTTFSYDEEFQSIKAIITIKTSDTKPVVNGKTLAEGTYTIWYENEKSISAKLELVKKYNLKGTGSWSLGQETANTWEYYMKKLNENEKDDSKQTEIENQLECAYWAVDSVEYVKENGWMQGKTEGEFYPKDNLTRAEFATIIVRILNLEENTSEEYKYTDTNGHWAESCISLVTINGYMEGYDDGTFRPERNITRAEVVKVLSKMKLKEELQKIELENIKFNDISAYNWAYESIIKMAQYGIITGYGDGTFGPGRKISREETAVVLQRAF